MSSLQTIVVFLKGLIWLLIIIIIANDLRLSTRQPEPEVRLFAAYFGCLVQADRPYAARWLQTMRKQITRFRAFA